MPAVVRVRDQALDLYAVDSHSEVAAHGVDSRLDLPFFNVRY
jgi:hypothetical protein